MERTTGSFPNRFLYDSTATVRISELAFEGFRFDNLMRTGKDILAHNDKRKYPQIGFAYGSAKLAFPIPADEINANSNMIQNDGY